MKAHQRRRGVAETLTSHERSCHVMKRRDRLCTTFQAAALYSKPPNQRSKLTARQTSSYVAEYTAHIPQRAMMSFLPKLWESVIQGLQNKAASRDSKYITAHLSPPQSSIGSVESFNLDPVQAGTTAHTALLEWQEKEGSCIVGAGAPPHGPPLPAA